MDTANQDKASDGTRYLSFALGTEHYAIPLLCVKEVIALPEITPIPFTPSHFLGIMNLRGQVISVIDLRLKLGIKANASAENAVIICDMGLSGLGVVVDTIDSVMTPKESEISEKPEIQSTRGTEYIINVFQREKRLILHLDIIKALSGDDKAAIARAAKSAPQVA